MSFVPARQYDPYAQAAHARRRILRESRPNQYLHPLLRLQSAVGNHTVRQLLAAPQSSAPPQLLLRQPTPKPSSAPATKPAADRVAKEETGTKADLGLPWQHGDYSLFEEWSVGIRILVASGGADIAAEVRKAIPAIAAHVAADNKAIKAPEKRVMTCVIAPTTTRFAFLHGTPVLMLDPADANVETAAHEMGHAIFQAYDTQGSPGKQRSAPAAGLHMQLADIYARLQQTKEHTIGEKTVSAGLWIADPSVWNPGAKSEHPWDDPDELFASAKEAYQVNRAGFKRAIAAMTKVDPAVRTPASDLLGLLDTLFTQGKRAGKAVPKERTPAAEAAMARTGVSNVEDTVMGGTPLDWLLNPEHRPRQRKAQPALQGP